MLGPEVGAAAGVDELGVDPHAIAARLHRAFENIAHAEILADRRGVDRLALEGHGRIARDDESAADTRETGGQFIGQGVDEVVLPRIAREVGEGHDDDGKTRGLGGRLRRDACGPVRIKEPPRAARDHNQQRRDAGGERGQPRTLFRRGPFGRPRCADLQRVGSYRVGDVLQRHRAEITDLEIESRLDLPIGVVGDAYSTRLGDPL